MRATINYREYSEIFIEKILEEEKKTKINKQNLYVPKKSKKRYRFKKIGLCYIHCYLKIISLL